MRKPIKVLGMAFYAAMAVLLAVDSSWRQPKSAAGDYEEFSGCPLSTEYRNSGTGAWWKGTVEACKSIESAFTEIKMTFLGSPAPSSNTDSEASGFALNVDLTALNTREAWDGGGAGKEIAPDIAVADIYACA